MPDKPPRPRSRTSSPIPEVSATALHYKLKAMHDRLAIAEWSVDKCRAEHTQNTQNLRAEVATLSDAVREIGTVKKMGAWAAGVFIPMLIIAAIAVIQSITRQDQLEKKSDKAEQTTIQVQTRIGMIEQDVSAIKQEQQSSRKTLEKVSNTLGEMRDSQTRMEEALEPRSRRRR